MCILCLDNNFRMKRPLTSIFSMLVTLSRSVHISKLVLGLKNKSGVGKAVMEVDLKWKL